MSNQTLRDVAQAFIDDWNGDKMPFYCSKHVEAIKRALAQPDPEPTLCGMDEEGLGMFVNDVRSAKKHLEQGRSRSAEIRIARALNLIPVERKTWTVPTPNRNTVAAIACGDLELPKGIEVSANLCADQSSVRLFIAKGNISLAAGWVVDITDPDNLFIVGGES